MHINLSPEIEKYLQNKVNTGFYSNASEVVRDAIRRMWSEEQKLDQLRSALQIGDQQLDSGEGVVYSSGRLEAITQKAISNAKTGKAINTDVIG